MLLWLDLTHDQSTEALMGAFSAFSECRLVKPNSVVGNSQVRRIDMICMHYDQPDALGLMQLQQIKRAAPSVPITMFTVQHSEELAVWAMRSQVWEYLTLPLSSVELQRYRQALLHLCEVRQNAEADVRKTLSEHYPNVPVSIQLTAKHQKHRLVERAIQHIDRRFRENVDQKELAQLCGMTPSRFSRVFKDAYGVCYLEYVLGKRMEFAKDRLDNSQMPITTIGYEAGFRDPSYFARVFKQFTGVTPSEYRQVANISAAAQAPSQLDIPCEPPDFGYDILA